MFNWIFVLPTNAGPLFQIHIFSKAAVGSAKCPLLLQLCAVLLGV